MQVDSLEKIEISNDNIYLIDIDGVMCKSYHYSVDMELNENEWINAKKDLKIEESSKAFVKRLLDIRAEFYFVTGRYIDSKSVTDMMFINADLLSCIDKIYYASYKGFRTFDRQIFIEFKVSIAKMYYERINHNIKKKLIIIDDCIELIDVFNQLNINNLIGILYALPYLELQLLKDRQKEIK